MGDRHPILTCIAPPFLGSLWISKMSKDTRIVLIHTGRTDLEQSCRLSFARPTHALLADSTWLIWQRIVTMGTDLRVEDAFLANLFEELLKRVSTDTGQGCTRLAHLHKTNEGNFAQFL